jgi:hypothetical protein
MSVVAPKGVESVICRDYVFAISSAGTVEDALKFLSHRLNKNGVIHLEENRSQKIGRTPCPVFKGLFKKMGDGQNEAQQIPDSKDRTGQRDFFNAPQLPFHNDHIIN